MVVGMDAGDAKRHKEETTECKYWDISCIGIRHWDGTAGKMRLLKMHTPKDRRDICLCGSGVPALIELCKAHSPWDNVWTAELRRR